MSLLQDFTKLNKTSRYSISAALTFLAILAVYNWAISPHTKYLAATQKYQKALDEKIKTNKIISNNLKSRAIKLEKLNNELESLKKIAFSEKDAKKFWSVLKQFTENAGCSFDSISIFKEKNQDENSAFVTESAALSITGNYNGITQIIKKITSYPKKTWIDSLQLQTVQQSSLLQCDITITIYKINKEQF